MKVKIAGATNNPWYKDLIGKEYEVEEYNSSIWKLINSDLTIYKQDCIEVDDEKYLQVSLKIQPDGKTVIAECTHIADELRGKGILAEKDGYKIRSDYGLTLSGDILYVRGKYKERDYIIFSYNFKTPQQAQHYVKIMNELIDEINNTKTNWSKVEDGTEIKILDNGNIVKFMKYIPDLKTVIVREGDYFYTIYEDKVELC